MDTNGSIRNSEKASRTSFRPSSVEPALLGLARQFLESYTFDMIRIRQQLYPEKMENAVSRNTYYVLGNEQRFEPGFLVCMKDKPLVFMNSRLNYGFTLRLRLHESLHREGAIFVGTLDTVHGTLRLEDVFLYLGKTYCQSPYSKRYAVLQDFYKNAFVQDTRLSNMTVFVAEPRPLATLRDAVDSNQFHSIDLIPEQGGRRRWHIPLVLYQNQQLPKKATATEILAYNLAQTTPLLPVKEVILTEERVAIATKVPGLPDTFDLFSKDKKLIGRAAVQKAEISMKMRQMTAATSTVTVLWDDEFLRYKIIDLSSKEADMSGLFKVSAVSVP
jgi:hypothetical protein